MCIKFGLSLNDYRALDPIERRAFIYFSAESEGNSIEWETGRIYRKD